MRVYENQTYTPPAWRFSGHPVVDIGGQEQAVNKQTHTADKESLNKQLEQQQIAYVNAKARGDKQAMEEAAKNGAELRSNGADLKVSGAAAALQRYYEQSGVKVAISSHSVEDLNKGILQAKNDYAWAKANNDQAGMAAASQLASNMRALGGTIGASASLQDAKNIVYGTQSKPNQSTNGSSTQTQSIISKLVSFGGGVIYSAMNNTSNGALHTVANDDSLTGKSYVAGKVVGDLISTGYGMAKVGSGTAMATGGAIGGTVTSETVVGALVGGAVATAGVAQASYGTVTVGTSLSNLWHDTMSLVKSSNNGSGGSLQGLTSDLNQAEASGGHTLEKHVGQTDQELIDRANNDPTASSASSFLDKSTAQKAIDATIKSNQQAVDKFVQSAKPGAKKAFDYAGDGTVIGKSVQKGSTTVENITKAKVIIKKDSNGGFVLTAYPTK